MKKMKLCKETMCLNNESGKCEISKYGFFKIQTNTKKCQFYDDDFEKTFDEWKKNNTALYTSVVEQKQKRRKPRSDKGKSRKEKESKKTILTDLL